MARVLIVDDYPDTATSLALILAAMGHQARACTSGHEALAVAAEFLPEVALIDIHMPDLTGHEVARALRAVPGLGYSLLVAMTGFEPGDKRRAPEGDFDLFLLKPLDVGDLDRLMRVLGG